MTEYVERDRVLALQTNLHFDGIEQLKYWECQHIDPTEVQLLPATDVVPVVHGYWVNMVHAVVDTTANCSECRCEAIWRTRNNPYIICPNCGARMDGGADDA